MTINPRKIWRQPNHMPRPLKPLSIRLKYSKLRKRFLLLTWKKSTKLTILSKKLLSQSPRFKWLLKSLLESKSSFPWARRILIHSSKTCRFMYQISIGNSAMPSLKSLSIIFELNHWVSSLLPTKSPNHLTWY